MITHLVNTEPEVCENVTFGFGIGMGSVCVPVSNIDTGFDPLVSRPIINDGALVVLFCNKAIQFVVLTLYINNINPYTAE